MAIEAVFFDLDGTLLDTGPDLADACNQVLYEYQRPPVDYAQFRHWIHGGAAMIIRHSFQIEANHPDFSAVRTAFLRHYRRGFLQKTQQYAGIDEVLAYLEQHKIPWGIVTNKLSEFAQPLAARFGWEQRYCCLISGDTLATPKPHPAPLLYACQLAKAEPCRSIYVGDSATDIEAAHAAQMMSIAVSYGYPPENSDLAHWQADAIAPTPVDLQSLLQNWQ
jgi:N-acetyl-D-muramate 6-phosphate phosphatase